MTATLRHIISYTGLSVSRDDPSPWNHLHATGSSEEPLERSQMKTTGNLPIRSLTMSTRSTPVPEAIATHFEDCIRPILAPGRHELLPHLAHPATYTRLALRGPVQRGQLYGLSLGRLPYKKGNRRLQGEMTKRESPNPVASAAASRRNQTHMETTWRSDLSIC